MKKANAHIWLRNEGVIDVDFEKGWIYIWIKKYEGREKREKIRETGQSWKVWTMYMESVSSVDSEYIFPASGMSFLLFFFSCWKKECIEV